MLKERHRKYLIHFSITASRNRFNVDAMDLLCKTAKLFIIQLIDIDDVDRNLIPFPFCIKTTVPVFLE